MVKKEPPNQAGFSSQPYQQYSPWTQIGTRESVRNDSVDESDVVPSDIEKFIVLSNDVKREKTLMYLIPNHIQF